VWRAVASTVEGKMGAEERAEGKKEKAKKARKRKNEKKEKSKKGRKVARIKEGIKQEKKKK
jgi:hypothetical protein